MKYALNIPIKFLAINALFISSALAVVSCSSQNEEAIEIASETQIESQFVVSKKQFTSSNMELGKLQLEAFNEEVKANGMFDVPPENRASINPYFGGTVKNIELLPGEHVKKGQTLFVLENPEFVQMQQDFLEAKSQLSYLKADYERQKTLAQDNVSSQKTLLKAESDYTVTEVKMKSLSEKLAMININSKNLTLENIHSTVNIVSPMNGYVTKVNISRGAFLNPSQTAIELVNTDHLHLELNIFEKDLAKIQVGQAIRFRIQEDDSEEYEASVHLINKVIDPEKRTINIHGHLVDESISDHFTPGMYVEASIYVTSTTKAALPQDAVVEMDGKHYVLLLEKTTDTEYHFSKKEVQTGTTSRGNTEILNTKDFKNNDEFLVKGAFNLIVD